MKLVDIEGLDVFDVGVGDGHIIALTGDGGVWVCGVGWEGQLGLGEGRNFEGDWKKVNETWEVGKVLGVEASSWGSWVLVEKAEDDMKKEDA